MNAETITANSLITLHYRVTNADGVEFISTFEHRPATLQLGTGELAPPFEQCLIGMPADTQRSFDMPPDAAFGAHNPECWTVLRTWRATSQASTAPKAAPKIIHRRRLNINANERELQQRQHWVITSRSFFILLKSSIAAELNRNIDQRFSVGY